MLLPWSHGKPLDWDVTVPDTYAASHLNHTSCVTGAAAETAAINKNIKYSSFTITHHFVPIAIETGGLARGAQLPLNSFRLLNTKSQKSPKTPWKPPSSSKEFPLPSSVATHYPSTTLSSQTTTTIVYPLCHDCCVTLIKFLMPIYGFVLVSKLKK